jgi:hypothetical protein
MKEWTEPMARFGAVRGTEPAPYGQPTSTQAQPTRPAPQTESNEPAGLAAWLATQEATQFVGQWVLLTSDHEVIDHASRPSELFDRHPEIRNPYIVFVKPRNIRFIG